MPALAFLPFPTEVFLLSLAQDLPAVWNAATADMRLKQRIMRILIQEIVADVDEATSEVVLLIHWAGGRHSELRVKKNRLGQHRLCTSLEAIEVIRQLAGKHTDQQIATTLNTLSLRTGVGHTWTEQRVYSARRYHLLPAFDPQRASRFVTLEQAAQRLGVSPTTVRRLIRHEKLDGTQVLPRAPWQISIVSLDSEAVQRAVERIKNGTRIPQTPFVREQDILFSAN
jgi:AraC-like DNA-binding protein